MRQRAYPPAERALQRFAELVDAGMQPDDAANVALSEGPYA
jgi:hypothetical protein